MCLETYHPWVLAYLIYKSISEKLSKLEIAVTDHLVDHANELDLGLLHKRLAVLDTTYMYMR